MSNSRARPKISIVTPSYNQGQYIDDTIQSVLFQGDANIEYIIMDGGSTDDSPNIIKHYEDHLLYWESKKDNGQADAINRGFAKSTGDILGWLNSDDMYLPGTIKKVQKIFSCMEDDAVIVFGNCMHLNEATKKAHGSDVGKAHETLDLRLADYIIQPASFWHKKVFDIVGPLNEELEYGFDWDWFIRAVDAGIKFVSVDDFFAIYRIHAGHKTGIGGESRLHELAAIYKNYHSDQLACSFLKLKSDKTIRNIYKFTDKSRLNRLFNVHQFIHNVFFRNITQNEFNHIRRM